MESKPKYVLITAAKNEEEFIEDTIKSVISQTIEPFCWIIVNDNSADNTEAIINKYIQEYKFIRLINRSEQVKRDFSSKVHALNIALKSVNELDYDFLGILDADISFEEDYYQSMLSEFQNNPLLGIAGGEFYDIINGKKRRVVKSKNSVRGGIQLFREKCFNEIQQFTPLKYGGEDVIMEVSARKNGWEVQSFEHQMLIHHRHTGTGGWSVLESKFREGILAYTMGYHPLFPILKSFHRFKERPFVLSGLFHLFGFLYGTVKSQDRPVSKEFIEFLRKEQLNRIKTFNF